MAPGGVDREAAPAAADVEHPLARLQAELRADELELGLLGLLERRRRRARRARSCRSSTRRGTARRTRCRRRSGGGPPGGRATIVWRSPRSRSSAAGGCGGDDQPAGAHARATPEPRLLARRQRRRLERVDDPQRRVEVVDLEQPGDVGAAEPELARAPAARAPARAATRSVNVGASGSVARHRACRPRTGSRTGGAAAPSQARAAAARCWRTPRPRQGPATAGSPCARGGRGRPARRPTPAPPSPARG